MQGFTSIWRDPDNAPNLSEPAGGKYYKGGAERAFVSKGWSAERTGSDSCHGRWDVHTDRVKLGRCASRTHECMSAENAQAQRLTVEALSGCLLERLQLRGVAT